MKQLVVLIAAITAAAMAWWIPSGYAERACAKEATCKNHMGCQIDSQIAAKKAVRDMYNKRLRQAAKDGARKQKIKELEQQEREYHGLPKADQRTLDNLRKGTPTPDEAKDLSHRATKILSETITKMQNESDLVYDSPVCETRGASFTWPVAWPPTWTTSRAYNCKVYQADPATGDPLFVGGKVQTEMDARLANTCSEFIDSSMKHEQYHQKKCEQAVKDPKLDREDIDTWADEETAAYDIEIAELERAKAKEGNQPRDCTPKDTERVAKAVADAKAAINALKGKPR